MSRTDARSGGAARPAGEEGAARAARALGGARGPARTPRNALSSAARVVPVGGGDALRGQAAAGRGLRALGHGLGARPWLSRARGTRALGDRLRGGRLVEIATSGGPKLLHLLGLLGRERPRGRIRLVVVSVSRVGPVPGAGSSSGGCGIAVVEERGAHERVS